MSQTFVLRLPNSTAIKLLGYNETTNTLRIIFQNGYGYDYKEISKEIFEELAAARSVGQSFWELLKRQKKRFYNKLSKEEADEFYNSALSCFQSIQVSIKA